MINAYYNEIDPFAAAWLRELISAGHIASGDVDERSIVDVRPSDIMGYTECHFFAGIGVWSYALRQAGWPSERGVWTGSCPCQPFSAAGRSEGFGDGRHLHLWPHFARLIGECRPNVIFGEQVASADGLAWLDFVCADLEAADYAVGAVDTCAAGFGAPHIRQRLYFVADANYERCGEARPTGTAARTSGSIAIGELADATDSGYGGQRDGATRRGEPVGDCIMGNPSRRGLGMRGSAQGESGRPALAEFAGVAQGDTERTRLQGFERPGDVELRGGSRPDGSIGPSGSHGVMADTERPERRSDGQRGNVSQGREQETAVSGGNCAPCATNGFWRNADWLPCRDGKARPVEPGTFPLAHGVAARVGRLRGYGNAINAEAAKEFISAYLQRMST